MLTSPPDHDSRLWLMKTSWKSTLAGAITALGTYLSGLDDPEYLATIGKVLMAVGTFILGAVARDNSVSSEEAGAK